LCNTVAVTDENENVVEEATYSAFGEVVSKTSSITNPFGYKGALGYYVNPETGSYDSRARVYEPITGRWMSLDPAEFIDGPNRYLYVANDPVNLVDPSGLGVNPVSRFGSQPTETLQQQPGQPVRTIPLDPPNEDPTAPCAKEGQTRAIRKLPRVVTIGYRLDTRPICKIEVGLCDPTQPGTVPPIFGTKKCRSIYKMVVPQGTLTVEQCMKNANGQLRWHIIAFRADPKTIKFTLLSRTCGPCVAAKIDVIV
jgi:RHS repeat-associated protein